MRIYLQRYLVPSTFVPSRYEGPFFILTQLFNFVGFIQYLLIENQFNLNSIPTVQRCPRSCIETNIYFFLITLAVASTIY